MNREPTQAEVDEQIASAIQAKLRHGYSTQAVIIKNRRGKGPSWLGFFFHDGRQVGETHTRPDGSTYEVLAVI